MNIRPEIALYACAYVKSIINIFKNARSGAQAERRELKTMLHQMTSRMKFLIENENQGHGKQNSV